MMMIIIVIVVIAIGIVCKVEAGLRKSQQMAPAAFMQTGPIALTGNSVWGAAPPSIYGSDQFAPAADINGVPMQRSSMQYFQAGPHNVAAQVRPSATYF